MRNGMFTLLHCIYTSHARSQMRLPNHGWLLATKGITDAGAEAIGAFLELNLDLSVITLEDNAITDGGAQAIMDGVKQNEDSSMQSLKIENNKVSDGMIKKLEALLQRRAATSSRGQEIYSSGPPGQGGGKGPSSGREEL